MRERVINRAGLWAGLSALLAALLLAVALAPQANAQGGPPPPPPTWFWGLDFSSVNGADIAALDADGEEVVRARIANGQWSLQVPVEHSSVTFRITDGDEIRESAAQTTEAGRLRQLRLNDFTIVEVEEPEEVEEEAETIQAQVRARLATSGRLEFGARRVGGENVLPTSRFLPTSVVDGQITPEEGITHGRWLRSSPIDLGDGYVIRVMARVAPDGRIEFGFYLDDVDAPVGQYNSGDAEPMFLPSGRYFPGTLERLGRNGRDVNRWLSSTPVDIPPAP